MFVSCLHKICNFMGLSSAAGNIYPANAAWRKKIHPDWVRCAVRDNHLPRAGK
jgi:hypothetical protein